ncbi:MAG: hypothetical protein H7249_00410, partial [Chitinophagaceae bacterium]|nr:hypothetical protein [Oligoflexus sp.]
MTTLALKTVIGNKIIISADAVLCFHSIKSGRYWYKGQQNCDLIFYKKGKETIIHASGGVRFRIALSATDDGVSNGTLSLLGWLRETPNAIRIVTTLLASHAKEVLRRRELRLAMEVEAEESGEDKLELNEAIGSHFSIKADEDKIEEKNRISFAESDRNFEIAVKSRWYHQSFVNFCKTHDIKCYYRSVFAEPEQPRVLENVMDTMLWA